MTLLSILRLMVTPFFSRKSVRQFSCILAFLAGSGAAVHAQLSLLQTVRYSGPSNVIDQATAIAVDLEGNAYLTGSGDRNGPLLGGDIVTVKCAPSGVIIWTARYENPGRLADAGTAIAVDASGFIYVTGYSHGHPSLVSAQDFVTLKYAPDGTELWARRFSGPTNSYPYGSSVDYPVAIAADGAGNVYVTGSTGGSGGDAKDYATIKYDAEGNLLWSAIYDSPERGNDHVTSLAVNGAGEVFVGGYSGVVKYSSEGALLWHRDALVLGMALASNGDLVVAGPTFVDEFDEPPGPDYAVTRFASNGERRWRTEYNGAADEGDSATAVRIDDAGNIYVTGASAARCEWVFDSDSGRLEKSCTTVLVTLKLDGRGNQLWAARHSEAEGSVYPVGLELDSAGNAYVLGKAGTFTSAMLLKYAPDGTRLAVERFRDAQHAGDTPTGLAIAGNGGVHVGGYSYWWDGSSHDYFLLNYSSDIDPGLPVIVTPPPSLSVFEGADTSLSVVATGPGALRYQWYFNDDALPGGTNATLRLPHVSAARARDYFVEVRNDTGSVLSPAARLTVTPPPLRMRAAWSSSDGLGFTVDGVGVTSFVVETSADLQNWTAVCTNLVETSGAVIRLPSRSGPANFFRARALP